MKISISNHSLINLSILSLVETALTISQKGNNVEITITNNNQVLAIVDNTNAAQLNSDDFVSV